MLEDWPRAFPGCEPLAHRMRARLPDRWVRFHSLPESKRYPDHEDEFAVVLGRQNRVLGELLGSGSQAILLTTACYGATEAIEPICNDRLLHKFHPEPELWRSVAMHEVEEDWMVPTYWHVFGSEWTWRPGVFDPLLRLVAVDEICNVMILPPDCRWLFHPYDGGMDVILKSSAVRDRFKAAHAGWLSNRPDGL